MPQRVIVGITGASGAIYGIRLLEVLAQVPNIETHLVLTDAACQTITVETPYTTQAVEALANVIHPFDNIAASIASGSFQTVGMVVAPCSMRTLSAIAHSFADNVLTRAADVTLKEHRRLIVVPRETPLHLGHLRLMTQVAELGAIIVPPIAAFYHRPRTIDDIINHTVNRLVDLLHIHLPNDLVTRWQGTDFKDAPSAIDAHVA